MLTTALLLPSILIVRPSAAAQATPQASPPSATVPWRQGDPSPERLQGTVISIGDGDTLRVQTGLKRITVRLACIDAPEMAQRPFGEASRQYLQSRLPIGTPVSLEVKATDRYGRSVAEVFHELNIGLVMVEDGKAFAYRQFLARCPAEEYLDAEQRASRHHFGIWQTPGGITRPWIFRHAQHSARIPDGTTPGGQRYRCREIGSYTRAQELLREGHAYLDANGNGQACESLPH